MIVAGDHANNDMAGDEEDSWKTAFVNAGYEVECVLNGLGQYEGVQQILIDHAAAAISGEEGPVYADQLADGVYEITVESSSSMFKVVHCELTVADGTMTAAMTMSGDGYGKLYMGTGEAAAAAGEEAYIPCTENENGETVFTVPVEALDAELDCAAWSIKKETWYDRTLIFESANIPAEAFVQE